MGQHGVELRAMIERERARFMEKLEISDEILPGFSEPCLIWTGATDGGGRGIATYRGKRQSARRVAHQLAHDCVLVPGVVLVPQCGITLCVQDPHLEILSLEDAGRRSGSPGKPLRLPASIAAAQRALARAEHERDLAERRLHAHRANVQALEAAEAMAS